MTRNFPRYIFSSMLLAAALAVAAYAQSAAPASKHVEIFGQKIHYLEAGSASNPAVILLHGLGGDTTNWAMTVPALASKYHVFVPDQIGFGQSDKPIANYRVAMLVEFLDVFYRKLNIHKATLVGNSLGGWTAASFAAEHPEKVDKLVLVCAAGYTPKRYGGVELSKETLSAANPSTTADLKRLFGSIFYNKAMQSDPVVEQALAAKFKRGDGYTINSFIESILRGEDYLDGKVKNVKAPTMVLWGREDGLTPLAIGKAFAEDIPGAKLVIIEQCGHVPQMEKPAEFNAALLKFFAGESAAATGSK
jgi:pimeloyl-ACP methyl ester carboxylesterase